MTFRAAKTEIVSQLSSIYDREEAISIAKLLIENVAGLSGTELLMRQNDELSASQLQQMESYLIRLMSFEPLQYVLQTAWFMGLPFYVEKGVLIPRPETEELVAKFIDENPLIHSVLDVGTGSGCIALSIKKNLPNAEVFAMEVSSTALSIAKKNGSQFRLDVHWILQNVLDWTTALNALPIVDCIISNPPYICTNERNDMRRNVLEYEPELALFVSNEDPLLFYRRIAEMGQKILKANGKLYFEINETLGAEMVQLLQALKYTDIRLEKDFYGKDRFVIATLL